MKVWIARVLGPSPRGRGNPRRSPPRCGQIGSIPAWAGKPGPRCGGFPPSTVHPRVGGETCGTCGTSHTWTGPSPRGRGNRGHASDRNAGSRNQVHPRVGGETRISPYRISPVNGPSPRGRGNRDVYRHHPYVQRSIPAWAGKPAFCSRVTRNAGLSGSIPAWAGKPSYPQPGQVNLPWKGPSPRGRGNRLSSIRHYSMIATEVHPRVGGETARRPKKKRLSRKEVHPRVGGETDRHMRERHAISGCIPAWAGKPTTASRGTLPIGVHPRVGGETGNPPTGQVNLWGPSPRGRGNRGPRFHYAYSHGSIPAWAGKPRDEKKAARPRRLPSAGPSPRGRGNHRSVTPLHRTWRSIPAWAGKPHSARSPATAGGVHPRVGGETSCATR